MPTTVHSQNFDGVTAPARPTDWTFENGATCWDTSTTQAVSSPNSCRAFEVSQNRLAFPTGLTDGNGGDMRVSAYIRLSSVSAASLMARLTGTAYASCTGYRFRFATNGGTNPGISIYRVNTGTATLIGSAVSVPGGVSSTEWYWVQAVCNGSTISVYVQRVSDGTWLVDSGGGTGAWQASQAAAISITNTNITGAGNAGINSFSNGANTVFVDDFLFESLASGGGGGSTRINRLMLMGVGG